MPYTAKVELVRFHIPCAAACMYASSQGDEVRTMTHNVIKPAVKDFDSFMRQMVQ